MGLETGTFIDSLNSSWPLGATDPVSQGDDHIRFTKSTILATWPNITGAVTATHTELNLIDGLTSTTAELNTLDGFTGVVGDFNIIAGGAAAGVSAAEFQTLNGVTSAIQTQLDARLFASNNLSDLVSAATSRTNLGVDAAGTDNSTDVTLAGSLDYLTLSGQQITRGAIVLTTDVSGALPYANMNFSNNIVAGDIAAGAVDTSELAADGVTEAKIDWANAGGISQQIISFGGETSGAIGNTPVSIGTAFNFRFYVPANANSIEFNAEAKQAGAAGGVIIRLYESANFGEASTLNTSYTFITGTLDVSALSGWVTFEFKWHSGSGTDTLSLRYLSIRLI